MFIESIINKKNNKKIDKGGFIWLKEIKTKIFMYLIPLL